eukprot:CAMPEP_0183437868 /NCGR_PEP_ID=MMETSP0370-20130417/74977_1 /TAXON_ID=268820 /ORGANISM="Peridinium aciculiferum, Strain PAER-2" /LENGTH=66 /DNA_ID=CAMNT_0025625871 /DNA_START=12 /DNA_END=210 /DNA_ORIENTATION=+
MWLSALSLFPSNVDGSPPESGIRIVQRAKYLQPNLGHHGVAARSKTEASEGNTAASGRTRNTSGWP